MLRTWLIFVILCSGPLFGSWVKPTIHVDTQEGVVEENTLVVFGWTAAKYQEIKEKQTLLGKLRFKNFVTIETPLLTTMFSDQPMKTAVDELADLLKGQNVYVLYYSGGGSLYHPIVHQKLKNIRGYIFDSAPVPFGSMVFAHWLQQKVNSVAATAAVVPLSLYMYTAGYKRLNHYNDYIREVEFGCQSLFITSENDSLVPFASTQAIVVKQGSTLLAFKDSEHISHDAKYPEEYLAAIARMLPQ